MFISCNCVERDEDLWEIEEDTENHPDWSCIECTGCGNQWLYHNVGVERTVIVADWERTGWRLFVFCPFDLEYDGHYLEPVGFELSLLAPNGDAIHPRLTGGYYLNDLPKEFFLESNFFANGPCDLIIENAHLRRATETSLAQVYDEDQLRTLFDRMNGQLRIFEFPNTLTGRARLESGIETSRRLPENQRMTNVERAAAKTRDPEAILDFTLRRRSVLLRRFDPLPKIEVEDGLERTSLALEISHVAEYMAGIGNQEVAELLSQQSAAILDAISHDTNVMNSIETIRGDYNHRLNPLRTENYDPHRVSQDLATQIEDAVSILSSRFGRMPEFNETELTGCINGEITELQVFDEELQLLNEYRAAKTVSWPNDPDSQPSNEELKAQWITEYGLLNEFVNIEQEPWYSSKDNLEQICDENHIYWPPKNKEWFRLFLIDRDVELEERQGEHLGLGVLKTMCRENNIPRQEYVQINQKAELVTLLVNHHVEVETVPGGHLSKAELLNLCRENDLSVSTTWTLDEIKNLIPYQLRLNLQTGNLKSGAKMNAIMSLYCCVFDNNQFLRRNENTGLFIGVDFIWSRLLLMSQYHGGASGVPRANLMWYVLTERFQGRASPGNPGELFSPRIQLGDDDSPAYITRQIARKNWRKAMKLLIRIFRDAGQFREAGDRNA